MPLTAPNTLMRFLPGDALINILATHHKEQRNGCNVKCAASRNNRVTSPSCAAFITGLSMVSTHSCCCVVFTLAGTCPVCKKRNLCRFINERKHVVLLWMP